MGAYSAEQYPAYEAWKMVVRKKSYNRKLCLRD